MSKQLCNEGRLENLQQNKFAAGIGVLYYSAFLMAATKALAASCELISELK